MRTSTVKTLILGAIFFVLAACSSGTQVSRVVVLPISAEIAVGESVLLSAKVFPTGVSQTLEWKSSNPAVAGVDKNTGQVIGNTAGEATITATSKADPTKSATSTVKVNAVVSGVTLSATNTVLLSLSGTSSTQLSAIVEGTTGISQEVTWDSDNSGTVSVDSTGRVTAVAVGSATITATSKADSSKSASVTVQVVGQLTLNDYPAINATVGQATPAQSSPNIAGGDSNYTYSLDAANPTLPTGLALNPTTGVIGGTPTAVSATKTYKVKVKDGLNANASANISITINAAPALAYPATNALTVGAVTNIAPTTNTGGSGSKTYTLNPVAPATGLPAGLAFSATTGAITGTPTTVTGATTPSFTVTVSDANNVSATSAAFSIAVTSNLAIAYTQARALTVGRPIAEGPTGNYTKSVTGATGATTFALTGTLPTGLAFATDTGIISGTVDAALAGPLPKSFPLTVQVTDAGSGAVKSTTGFSLTVNAAPAIGAAAYNSGALALTAGTVFTSAAPTVTGGTGTIAYSVAPALPTGMALSPTTGVVTGSAATAATPSATFVITATDANGATASKNVTIVINAIPSVGTGYTSPETATQGVPFTSSTPIINGGTAPITYSLAPATTLPAGLTVTAATGVITGTPSAISAAANYTIRATDANGAFVALTINIEVLAPPPPAP